MTLRTTSPSPATPRAASIPPGQDAYATTPGADLNGLHDAFSAPTHAVTSYEPAEADGGGSRARTATASVRIEIGRRMPLIGGGARELAPGQSTTVSSFGSEEKFVCPSSVTATRSSIRTPNLPSR